MSKCEIRQKDFYQKPNLFTIHILNQSDLQMIDYVHQIFYFDENQYSEDSYTL